MRCAELRARLLFAAPASRSHRGVRKYSAAPTAASARDLHSRCPRGPFSLDSTSASETAGLLPADMRSSVTAGRSRGWGRACRTAGRARNEDANGERDGDGDGDAAATGAGGGKAALVAAVPLLAVIGAVAAAGGPQDALNSITSAVTTAGPLAPFYYGLAYFFACIALLPASVLTLGAGALFGPIEGTAVVLSGATAGATASFLIARYIARPYVEKYLSGQRTFKAVDSAIGRDGLKVVFLLRLSPLFPFSLGNYALGLSSVRLLDFVGATLVGILPATFAFVNIGAVTRAATEAATGEADETGGLKLLLYGVGAVATLLVTRAVSKAASAALEEEERAAQGGSRGALEEGEEER